ncbi:MAG TPA: ABC transporter substrate-binding protein [Micromonosporaceae bacterium]|nr:ABC transporter substrate-binding protein [Micromonosporaceae bacterium]
MGVRGTGRLVAIAVALIAATGLAACGDGAGAGGPQDGASTLRLGYFPNITHAPALIGVQNKIFEKHLGGVKLETTTFNAGPSAIEAMLSDAIDATYIGPNPAINGWSQSKGTLLRVIAGTTSGGAALVVKPTINSPQDLKGKKIATPQLGNTQDVALRYWLEGLGFATDKAGGGDVHVTPTPNAEIITGFADGAIDGAWVPEPFLSRLVVEHGGKVLLDEKTLWPNGDFVTTHLIVSKKFLDRNPTIVSNLLKGHLEAVELAATGSAEAKKAANDHLAALTGKGLPDNILDASFANLKFTVDPIASSLDGSAKHAQDVGLLSPVDLKGIYVLEPLNALLKQAGKPEVSAGGLSP